ncbi:hypothetical protein SAY86_011094 [Trapa natans]|uniref:Anaphase-promoting complex subunit 4-like WD40 domain-containing protein n=1 Tax=Trapa natans TaxID=22666 RepID=A0AAN7R4U7_TRANT|nr:hypothetical protein SAY86_011094 [Trapa natans]
MLEACRTSSPLADWRPSPVAALATCPDGSRVAVARDDGTLEIWLVSPGSVGWHCQQTIYGNTNSKVSSLVWSHSGRLFSSSIDGSVSEWDLYNMKQKTVLKTIGISIWQMAVSPLCSSHTQDQHKAGQIENGYPNEDADVDDNVSNVTSENEDDSDMFDLHEKIEMENELLALGCDDGYVRIYSISKSHELIYNRSLPRVSGRILSVTWSSDASMIYSGTSDGYIRCWDAKSCHEVYRITVGLGGRGNGTDLCVWSLLALRSGTLVSGDSTGSVQFWDSRHGTLVHAFSLHKGDVNALMVAPNHNRVFSAGSDGQVILYKLSSEITSGASNENLSIMLKKWIYVGYVRAHTHDIRSLTIALPISQEDALPDERFKRPRRKEKPIDFSYKKWACVGSPMLISAGDDAKLFAYTVHDFTKFAPHDICPTPQRLPIHLVNSIFSDGPLLLVQSPYWLDILSVKSGIGAFPTTCSSPSGSRVSTGLLARVKSKASRRIVCSAISSSGSLFAYSDHMKPSLFEISKSEDSKNGTLIVKKKQLPQRLPCVHSMVFNFDSSQLILAGHDRRIHVIDVKTSELLHTFKTCRDESTGKLSSDEPPITKMFTSSDGHWLAAINCFGDIYVYNLEIQRQHWFISRLDGASVTAGGFPPSKNSILVISTSSHQVYVFDVEAKQLGEWSTRTAFFLPKRFQEFPGEVIGLSFPPSSTSLCCVIYSSRAMCGIDFGLPVDEEDCATKDDKNLALKKLPSSPLVKGKRKHSNRTCESINNGKVSSRKNFEFFAFRDPVMFIGHLTKGSVLIVDKPWMEVVKKMESAPVHRHVFGT